MADYDVEALSLATPPAIAPQQTYTPSIAVRNNGIHAAIASGTIQAYIGGVQVYSSNVLSEQIDAGDIGEAEAVDPWTPSIQGPVTFTGYVTTDHDQVEKNNSLSPVTIQVGPPPPPPEPKTLDDIYDVLLPAAKDTTVAEVVEKLPTSPATEPTLEEVRDKITTDPATQAAQLAQIDQVEAGIPVTNVNLLNLDSKTSDLESAIEPPSSLQVLNHIEVGTTRVELAFSITTRVITIQARSTNSASVFVGDVTVTSMGEHALHELTPGSSLAIEFNDVANPLYVVAAAPAQEVLAGAIGRV